MIQSTWINLDLSTERRGTGSDPKALVSMTQKVGDWFNGPPPSCIYIYIDRSLYTYIYIYIYTHMYTGTKSFGCVDCQIGFPAKRLPFFASSIEDKQFWNKPMSTIHW